MYKRKDINEELAKWEDLNKELEKCKDRLILKLDINDLAIKFHKTKAIPLATELADKVYKIMVLDGVVNEKS